MLRFAAAIQRISLRIQFGKFTNKSLSDIGGIQVSRDTEYRPLCRILVTAAAAMPCALRRKFALPGTFHMVPQCCPF